MKRKKYGFTILEILTVMVVIAILVGVLIPALMMVQRIAKETQQRAQLSEINLALEAFKGDYGDYPPSAFLDSDDTDYCGAQMLSEALVGWDLMGFHPDSEWNGDGRDDDENEIYPDSLNQNDPCDIANLKERRGPYLELATARVFKVGRDTVDMDGLFENPLVLKNDPYDTYVICDVYSFKKVRLSDGSIVKAGTPILYYRANTSKKRMDETNWNDNIYNVYDNHILVKVATDEKELTAQEESLTLADPSFENFRDFVTDPKVSTSTMTWPYRPDSYILITAGADGLYGTEDDICNFGN